MSGNRILKIGDILHLYEDLPEAHKGYWAMLSQGDVCMLGRAEQGKNGKWTVTGEHVYLLAADLHLFKKTTMHIELVR
jgi:hypothetical protein